MTPYIVTVVVALIIICFIWGVVRLRKGNAQAIEAIRKVSIGDLATLQAEGVDGLRKGFAVLIDLTNREAAAKTLDDVFANPMKLKNTFEKAGFYWHFVLPLGALVGEFVRIHAGGVWKESSDGLLMEIPLKDGVVTCYPFDKVLKQANQGAKGDLYAFLLGSTQLTSAKGVP